MMSVQAHTATTFIVSGRDDLLLHIQSRGARRGLYRSQCQSLSSPSRARLRDWLSLSLRYYWLRPRESMAAIVSLGYKRVSLLTVATEPTEGKG